jgi:O-antigen ligase/Tfp pilus assembly protein PilF
MNAVKTPKFIYGLYLAILVFAPLAFGSVDAWALAVVETGAAFGLLLWIIHGSGETRPLVRVPGLMPLFFMLGWAFVQLIPLPAGLVAWLSPASYAAYQEGAGVLQPVHWMPLTLHPEATLAELLRLAGYSLFYVLSVQLLLDKERLKKTVTVVIAFAAVLSFLAILQKFNSNGRVLWIREIYEGDFFGPYINGNHMAGFLVMVLPLAVTMFLFNRPTIRYQSLRASLAEFLTHPTLNIHMLLGLSALICIVAIFLSLARGAIVSTCISIGFLGLGVMKITGNWRRGTYIVVASTVIILSVGWFGWEPIINKFDQLADQKGRINALRPVIWSDSFGIAKDFPVFGSGLGTFKSIYPSYRSFTDNVLFRHAHNDYLELLATGGIPFIIFMGWFICALGVQTFNIFRQRREPYCRFLYLGAAAGLVGIGLHCLVEFNFQIGANGVYFFFIASLLVAAAHTRLHATNRRILLKILPMKIHRVFMFMAVGVIVCAAIHAIGVGIADSYYADTPDTMMQETLTREAYEKVEKPLRTAAALAPLNHIYPFLRAEAAAKAGLAKVSVKHYLKSLQRNPTSALTLQEFGRLLERESNSEHTEKLLRTSIQRSIQNPDGYRTYAEWLISQERKKEGLGQMRMAIERDPTNARDYIDSMDLWGLSAAEMAHAIPGLSEPCLAMAIYFEELADDDGAEDYYRKALRAETRSDKARAGMYQRIYNHYFNQEQWQEALEVMQQAVERLPENSWLRVSSARVYEKLGITYRATEEYQKALMLRPGLRAAQDGLRRLANEF